MGLTRSQKKYIKKHVKELSDVQLANNLGIPAETVSRYAREQWGEKKTDNTSPVGFTLSDVKKFFTDNIQFFFLLGLLVFFAYVNSFNNGFVSDDKGAILQNKEIGSLTNVFRSPLTFIRPFFYFIAYKIGGLSPLSFRLINIFFHTGSTWMIFIISGLMFNITVGFLAAAIFAVHPILIESVGWISGGPYSQYGFFLLLAFFFYILANKKKYFYVFSLFSFLFALSSSEKSIVLPIMIFSYEFIFGNLKKHWARISLFFGFSGVWFVLMLARIGERLVTLQTSFYQEKGYDNPLVQIPVAITSYLQLMIWPDKLTLYHSDLLISQFEYIIRLFFFILLVCGAGYFYKKNKLIFFWISFFVISLFPTLTPLRVSWVVAERYVYIGSAGMFIVFSWIIARIFSSEKLKKFYTAFVIIILIALIARTVVRNINWKNEDNLWIDTGKTSAWSPATHNNLGDMYFRWGNYEKSVEEFNRAIVLQPRFAEAYHNLANVYVKLGKTDTAFELFQKAVALNPVIWQAYQSLGAIYFERKQYDTALQYMQKAIVLAPTEPELYTNLAIIYFQIPNSKEKGKEALQKALQIDPSYQKAQVILKSLE